MEQPESDGERSMLLVNDIMLVLYATAMETNRFHWTIGIAIGVNSIIKYHVYERIPDVWEYETQDEELFDQGVLVTCLKIGNMEEAKIKYSIDAIDMHLRSIHTAVPPELGGRHTRYSSLFWVRSAVQLMHSMKLIWCPSPLLIVHEALERAESRWSLAAGSRKPAYLVYQSNFCQKF